MSPAPPFHRGHARHTICVEARRTGLDWTLPPERAALLVRGDERPFALTGAWAGGGALVGSDPVRVAGPGEDPFALLELDAVEGPGVHGGWVGWLGYRLGARVERLDPAPPRPHPLPDFQLAFYDHLLRLDAEGRWWFECLWTPERAEALAAREAELRERAAEPRPFITGPWSSVPGTGGHELAVAAARERIHAGDLFQANVCLRLESELEGDPLDLFAAGRAGAGARPGRVRGRAGRHGGGQPVARAVPGAPRPAGAHGADQGHPAALGRPGGAGALGQGPGREHDDRGPDAQRPRPRVRARLGDRGRAGAGAPARGRLAPGLRGLRRAARRRGRRRPAARLLPARAR